jgi:hypothetical protein
VVWLFVRPFAFNMKSVGAVFDVLGPTNTPLPSNMLSLWLTYPVLVGTVDNVAVSVFDEAVLPTAELGAVVVSLNARGPVGASMGAAVATGIGGDEWPYAGMAPSDSAPIGATTGGYVCCCCCCCW